MLLGEKSISKNVLIKVNIDHIGLNVIGLVTIIQCLDYSVSGDKV